MCILDIYSCNNVDRACHLKQEYQSTRENYVGFPLQNLDITVVSNVLLKLHRGEAPGIDGLMAEHLMYCRPILSTILSKLFTMILQTAHIPSSFKSSCIVPIPKIKDFRSKTLKSCQTYFSFKLPSVMLSERIDKLKTSYQTLSLHYFKL